MEALLTAVALWEAADEMLPTPGGPVSHLTSRDRRGLAVQGDSDIITTMASEEQSKGTLREPVPGWQLGAGRGILA